MPRVHRVLTGIGAPGCVTPRLDGLVGLNDVDEFLGFLFDLSLPSSLASSSWDPSTQKTGEIPFGWPLEGVGRTK
jgi:hypothetical protein